MATRSDLNGCARCARSAWSSSVSSSLGRAPRRSCLARMAATSTNRKRLSIGAAFGRGAAGAARSEPVSGVVRSVVSDINAYDTTTWVEGRPGAALTTVLTPSLRRDFDVDRARLGFLAE